MPNRAAAHGLATASAGTSLQQLTSPAGHVVHGDAGQLPPGTEERDGAFLTPYQEAKKKEEEQQRAHEAAARAAGDRRQALIRYGHQLAEHELASWAWDDPKDEARREVELVLQAEVKADWDEGKVRQLVTELLDQYEEDNDGDDEEVDDDDDGEGESEFDD